MLKLIEVLLWLFLFVAAVSDRVGVVSLSRQEGADVACATAKECPPDFKAKWVGAGCVCVPTATAK